MVDTGKITEARFGPVPAGLEVRGWKGGVDEHGLAGAYLAEEMERGESLTLR